jgi:hypothetical protein
MALSKPPALGGVVMAVYWHGTRQEGSELLHAISAHCSCDPTAGPAQTRRCPPHRMLVEDQRAVNGLLFARKILGRLLLEEWDLTATGWATTDRRAPSADRVDGVPGPLDPSAAPTTARA